MRVLRKNMVSSVYINRVIIDLNSESEINRLLYISTERDFNCFIMLGLSFPKSSSPTSLSYSARRVSSGSSSLS
ncbi:hypothetical protein Plhal304r1_c020g0073081 [Plasmopara halstedii]